MNVLTALKARFDGIGKRQGVKPREKRQFNTQIDPTIALMVKIVAKNLAVPMWVAAEQLLETGSFYVGQALADPKKQEMLRDHCINHHLLNIGPGESEEILRLGEYSYPKKFREDLKWTLRVLNSYKNAVDAASMGDPKAAEVIPKCRKELTRCIAAMILWVRLIEMRDGRPDEDAEAKESVALTPANATDEKPE